MKLKSFLATLMLSTSLLSTAVFAEEAKKEAAPKAAPIQETGYNFVGASLGLAKPVGANLSMPLRFNYGLEFSHAFGKEFAAGAFASRSNGEVVHDSGIDFGLTRVGLQAIYSPITDGYIDLRAGVSFLDFSANVGGVSFKATSDSHPIFWGPGFGWIFPVCDKIQIIPNLHYSHFLSTSTTEDFNVFDVMMTLRYTL